MSRDKRPGSRTLSLSDTARFQPRTLREASSEKPPSLSAGDDGTSAAAEAPLDETFGDRYRSCSLLGEGGMGEVHLTGDERIGRQVAMKLVRLDEKAGSKDDQQLRFLREARIQGQLEHPSIVPVYDLGRDPGGRLYFTMKRVRGLTLEEVLSLLGGDDASDGIKEQFSRRKLLGAFSSVCLAVDYAHAHGVLHRDLKPGNVMLGDFGEVYVLDWGLAKLIAQSASGASPAEETAPLAEVLDSAVKATGSTPVGKTAHGSIMGTPGYMAPEQVRGDVGALDARTDVYALGAILFEMLTGQPLHNHDTVGDLIASTLTGVEGRASLRCPESDVPPELEAICVKAAALDPAARFASARELHQAIERFLDGDRDLALRRELASGHASAAVSVAERALEGGDSEARSQALREVSRALALDPGNRVAMRTLMRLLTEPPKELPPDAAAESDAFARQTQSTAARAGSIALLLWTIWIPLALLMGVRSWRYLAVCVGAWATFAVASAILGRRPHPTGKIPWIMIVLSGLSIAATSLTFGPFIVVPAIAVIHATTFMFARDVRRRVPIVVAVCLGLALPMVLEQLGWWPQQHRFDDNVITILPQMLNVSPTVTPWFLLSMSVALVISSSVLVSRVRDMLTRAERRLQFNAWQLRQLVPDEAQEAVDNSRQPPSPPSSCVLDLAFPGRARGSA